MDVSSLGFIGIEASAIVCANAVCRKPSISARIVQAYDHPTQGIFILPNRAVHLEKRLLPESNSKPLPDFIPPPLREDYREACLIRDLSPKASATLARRCLQGMIRDFCGVAEGTLAKEVDLVRKMVEEGKAPQGV